MLLLLVCVAARAGDPGAPPTTSIVDYVDMVAAYSMSACTKFMTAYANDTCASAAWAGDHCEIFVNATCLDPPTESPVAVCQRMLAQMYGNDSCVRLATYNATSHACVAYDDQGCEYRQQPRRSGAARGALAALALLAAALVQ